MSLADLFSRRKKSAELHATTLAFVLPAILRGQICHILLQCMGPVRPDAYYPVELPSHKYWKIVFETVCEQQGTFSLGKSTARGDQCLECVTHGPIEVAIDIVELCLRIRSRIDEEYGSKTYSALVSDAEWYSNYTQLSGVQAIVNFNTRCEENSIGYRFVNGRIIELNSDFTHSQIIEPSLLLLRDKRFDGAHEEFLQAHKFFRSGEYKSAITEACKAFESTMKTICQRSGWTKNKKGELVEKLAASALVLLLKENDYFPNYLDSAMSGLVNLLSSGLGTIRNKDAAHGQGESVKGANRTLAEFAINQAATNILFLVKLLPA